MAISYPISLLNISAENTATNSNALSVLSTTANATTGTASQMIKVSPYAMSEFSGYSHFSGVYQGAGTSTYYTDGNYVNTSSIVLGSNAGVWNGLAVTVGITNINTGLLLIISRANQVFTNSGWTTLRTFNNSTGTGTPVFTTTRGVAQTFNASNNGNANAAGMWTLAGSHSLGTLFGFGSGSVGQARYLEIT
jgi:hypothetical protein